MAALQAVMIVVLGWRVFMPALHGDFLWDDHGEILDNRYLRSAAGLRTIWFGHVLPDYLPLKTTVQWIEWHLWGERSTGYHTINIGLHLLSALLIWRLLRRLGVRSAWLAGLLFAVHPLTVESVAWIAELKNTLSLPFLLLAMNAYLDWDGGGEASHGGIEGKRGSYLLSLTLFGMAMLAKTSAAMFPVTLLLYAWWRKGRIERRDLRASLPFFIISLALGLVTLGSQWPHATDVPGNRGEFNSDVPLIEGYFPRLVDAGRIGAFYLGKGLWPAGQTPLYPRWTIGPPYLPQLLPWLAGAAAAAWLWGRHRAKPDPGARAALAERIPWERHALFGMGCFLVNLVPVLGFVQMAYFHFSWVADHLAYVSLVPLVGLAAATFDLVLPDVDQERVRNSVWPARAKQAGEFVPYIVAAALVVAVLSRRSREYAAVFQSEESLWSRAVLLNPRSATAHFNLSVALQKIPGRAADAIAHDEAALRINPDYAAAHDNLGVALAKIPGRLPEAIAQIEAALQISPNYAKAHNNLGNALALMPGRLPDAVSEYEAALKINPNVAEAHNNLGEAFAQMPGRLPDAIAHFEAAIEIRPDYANAHSNLGDAFVQMPGRLPDAVAQFEAALKINPDSADAHYNLGAVLARMPGRLADAITQFRAALKINPDFAEAHLHLGYALLIADGRSQEALTQFEAALRLRPDWRPRMDRLLSVHP